MAEYVSPAGRLSPHAVVHAPDARDHRFGGTAGSVYGHHRRKPRAAKTAERVFAKTAVLPDAGPHSRLRKLENNGRHAADICGDRVLEDAPSHRIWRSERRFPRRTAEIDRPPTVRQEQLPRGFIEPPDNRPPKGERFSCEDIHVVLTREGETRTNSHAPFLRRLKHRTPALRPRHPNAMAKADNLLGNDS